MNKSLIYHDKSEKLIDILSGKTGVTDRHFLRTLVLHYFSIMASSQRTKLIAEHTGNIGMNMYSVVFAESGYGKNFNVNLLEEYVLNPFFDRLLEDTLPTVLYNNLVRLSSEEYVRQSQASATSPEEIMEALMKQYEECGEFAHTFDQATSPAVRQMRNKYQIAAVGSINLIIDEIGMNFDKLGDILPDFLTLYDKGFLKTKITKVTAESRRGIQLDDPVPATMLMFGTPSELMDGGNSEEAFFRALATGYARRLIFAYANSDAKRKTETAEERYKRTVSSTEDIVTLDDFTELGNFSNYNKEVLVPEDVAIKNIAYGMACEELASELNNHDNLTRTELLNRSYKALKIAGIYAFIDGKDIVTEEYLNMGITYIEESAKSFAKIDNREPVYVKLAKYFRERPNKPLTKHDLVRDLPFFKGSESHKRDMLELAIAYGYTNSIIVSRKITNGVEFYVSKSLKETDLSKLNFSYSTDIAYNYENIEIPFNELKDLTTTEGIHFSTQHYHDGHRRSENINGAFNVVCLDIDDGTKLSTVQTVLENYKYFIYTTKRHRLEGQDRFRVVLPISHELSLNREDYKKFMDNIFMFLPFNVDQAAKDPARKWLANDGEVYINDGEETKLLESSFFIPDTRKAEEIAQDIIDIDKNGRLFRWFYNESKEGNRNNTLLRYGYTLLDNGYSLEDLQAEIYKFNNLIPIPLPELEIKETVLNTLGAEYLRRE